MYHAKTTVHPNAVTRHTTREKLTTVKYQGDTHRDLDNKLIPTGGSTSEATEQGRRAKVPPKPPEQPEVESEVNREREAGEMC